MRVIKRVLVAFACLASSIASAGNVDPAKWAQLRSGMAEAEVLRILGEPERREKPASNRTTLIYGEIVSKGQIFPKGLKYIVWLDENKVIDSVETPFGRAAPRSGVPGNPDIFLPQKKSVFTHYPRLVDVRWHAVAGSYPMTYEVAYEYGYTPTHKPGETATLIWHLSETFKTEIPYLSLQHRGAQPGRVKVRAINSDGAGPWSDYTEFRFTQ